MADPLSIPMAVITLSGTSVEMARALTHLYDKYKHAELTIASIASECNIISASLTCVQQHIQQDTSAFARQVGDSFDLRELLINALTDCSIVFRTLEDELDRLMHGASYDGKLSWKTKAKYIWKEGTMNDLLSQLRGQQSALALLIQTLQMRSMDELRELIHTRGQSLSLIPEQPAVLTRGYSFELNETLGGVTCSINPAAASTVERELDSPRTESVTDGRLSTGAHWIELDCGTGSIATIASSASTVYTDDGSVSLRGIAEDASIITFDDEHDLSEACDTRRIDDLRQQLGEIAILVGDSFAAILHKTKGRKLQSVSPNRTGPDSPRVTHHSQRHARPRSEAWRV